MARFVGKNEETLLKDLEILSTCSEASSVCDEERIRKLFQVCDKNGDGYIDSNDLRSVCQELDMEDDLQDILVELGADENGMVSFEEFLQKRLALKSDIRALKDADNKYRINEPNLSSSGTSLGGLSASKEMWEFDSGAHDLSPIPNTLQRLIEVPGSSFASSSSAGILELANKLHMAAVESLRNEVSNLTAQLEESRLECHNLKIDVERCRTDSMVESIRELYEEQITELHSVIAELSRKAEKQSHSIIEEETVSDVEVNQLDVLKANECDESSENSPQPALSEEEEKKIPELSPSNKIVPNTATNVPPRLAKVASQEADLEYWKSLYHKEKADSSIIEAQNQKIVEKLHQMALLFARNESAAFSYEVALQCAIDVIEQYYELDCCMQEALTSKQKRTKELFEIRKVLNDQLLKLDGLYKNLVPCTFFSESNTFEELPSEAKPNIDLEAAILIQDLMQERVEKIETRQKLIKTQSECNSLRRRLKKLDGGHSSQSSGLSNKVDSLSKDNINDIEESNNDQTKAKDLLTSLQCIEKADKIKLLENKFTQLVSQHSEQVKTLKKRIHFLESLISET